MSEQQTAHETAFAEVIPLQPVCSGNVAVTVRISEVEANIHKGIPTKQVEHRLEGEESGLPSVRGYHDGDWQGSRQDAGNRPCPVYRPRGRLLYLRL